MQWPAISMPSPVATFMSNDQPEASSSAEVANSCAIARGIMPCCAGVPSIVCVLPEPVAPAAVRRCYERHRWTEAEVYTVADVLWGTVSHAIWWHTVSKDADAVAVQCRLHQLRDLIEDLLLRCNEHLHRNCWPFATMQARGPNVNHVVHAPLHLAGCGTEHAVEGEAVALAVAGPVTRWHHQVQCSACSTYFSQFLAAQASAV